MNFDHPYMNKEAGRFKDILLKRMLPAAGMTAAMVGIPLALTGAISGVKALHKAKQIEQSYEQMFDENPALQAMKEDGHEHAVRKSFDILKQYAPDLAVHPMVASSYVQNMMEQRNAAGMFSPQAIQLPVEMQGKIRQTTTYSAPPPWLLAASVSALGNMKSYATPQDFGMIGPAPSIREKE